MGGIGLSCRQPQQPIITHTYAQDTHIRNNTPQQHIYAQEYNTTISGHRTRHRTQRTEQDTEHNAQNKTQNTTHNLNTRYNTEHSGYSGHSTLAQPQHRCITYDLHTYSFDFIVEDYISKNSIIQLYTKLIHFGHLIDEVSKITIILIHRKNIIRKCNKLNKHYI